jgi:phosphoribosyl 1,2-cyclic phosphate phosphodiesterase
MNFLLLGSAAAEGYPGLFCECERCLQARAAGGKNLRFRAGALINDDLLIDFGPDLLAASHRHNLSLAKVRSVLITHFHEDHWLLDNLLYHHPWFCGKEMPALHLYGGPRLEKEVEILCDRYQQTPEDFAVRAHVVRPFERFDAGPYQISAFPAEHSPHTDPLIYAVSRESRILLYVSDTGPLADNTWEALSGLGAHLVVMELTMGPESHEGHLGKADFLAALERMKKEGVIAPAGRIIAHHFSHHHTPLHAELEAGLASHGIIAGFDGLSLEA